MKISILGNGAWGTALSCVLCKKQNSVYLFGRNQKSIEEINQKKTNSTYLPNVLLPTNIKATDSLEKTTDASVIFLTSPVNSIRSILIKLSQIGLPKETILVSCAKGIERETKKRVSQICEEILPKQAFATLSGPNHAEEIAQEMIACSVIGSQNLKIAQEIQNTLKTPFFRIYTSTDITGIEWAGALKNIYAIAGGMADGFKVGDNAKAALISRSLAEMIRIGLTLGGKAETFQGLSGIGDLIVTCFSHHSRNYQLGKMLAQGFTFSEAKEKIQATIEGASTIKVVKKMTKEKEIRSPLVDGIYSILYEKTSMREALNALLASPTQSE